ncbi:MAG: TetR/AcrR family transcriptional regulator [Clostridia bacterium]|nr:TetR/AcrR family transcriptional regulator [Clostridia bacterium]
MEKESVNLNTKTHRRLRRAYCRLLKGNEKINVSSLTEEAEISRATFYLYYKDIDEFLEKTADYIVNAFTSTMIFFLNSTRSEVMEKCKRKNLTLTDDDFELFHCVYKNDRGFSFDKKRLAKAFEVFHTNTEKYFSQRFITKNKSRFELFYIGYVTVMRDDFFDYHSDRVARDVLRTMDVWDYLFPDYKYKS